MSKEKIEAIVIRSEFNSDIVENLYLGVEKCFEQKKILVDIKNVKVPGAFELPYMAKQAIALNPDCIITLGCVIKGETAHFEYISSSCANTLSQLTITTSIPIMFGVITAYTRDQALKRSEVNFENSKNINIGYNVTNAAIETLQSRKQNNI